MVIFHSYVNVYQRVNINCMDISWDYVTKKIGDVNSE